MGVRILLCLHSYLTSIECCSLYIAEEGLPGGGGGHPGSGGGEKVSWNREEDGQVWRVPAGLL